MATILDVSAIADNSITKQKLASNVQTSLTKADNAAVDSAVVHKAGDETVAGKKTFTSEIGITSSASMQYDASNECIKFVFN